MQEMYLPAVNVAKPRQISLVQFVDMPQHCIASWTVTTLSGMTAMYPLRSSIVSITGR